MYLERQLDDYQPQDRIFEIFGELFSLIATLRNSHGTAMTKSDLAQNYGPGYPHGLDVWRCFHDSSPSNTSTPGITNTARLVYYHTLGPTRLQLSGYGIANLADVQLCLGRF